MTKLVYILILFFCNLSNAEERYSGIVEPMLFETVSITSVFNTDGGVLRFGGSGVFISLNGHILTCHHLFKHEGRLSGALVKTYWKDEYVAELIYSQPHRDLAIIKINDRTPRVLLEKASSVKVGTEVIAIGSSMGLDFTITNGIISALHRDIGIHYNMTQSNAAINPGNSGGPLFNLQGNLVGINVSMLSIVPGLPVFTGLGFAVSVEEINKFLDQLRGI